MSIYDDFIAQDVDYLVGHSSDDQIGMQFGMTVIKMHINIAKTLVRDILLHISDIESKET